MSKRTLVLAYQDCILFEIIPAAQRLEALFRVQVATPDGRRIRDSSGLTVHADCAYGDVAPADWACVLVPGGNPDRIADDAHVPKIVQAVLRAGGVVAGICAGVAVLGLAGALAGRRIAHSYTESDVPADVRVHTDPLWQGTTYSPEGVSSDSRVVTARPERYTEFAAAVAEAFGPLAPALAWIAAFICYSTAPPPQARGTTVLNVGDSAPPFTLRSHDGESISLDGLKGNWVVLHSFPFAFTGG